MEEMTTQANAADQVLERLAQSLDQVSQFVQASANFAVEQAPLVVQEMIRWEIVSSVVVMAFGIALVTGGVFTCVASRRLLLSARERGREVYEDGWIPLAFIGPVVGVIGLVMTVVNLISMLQPIVAPRLFVIEKIGSLLR